MTRSNQLHFATRCVHAGQEPDPTTGAVITPLYLTSTYAQDDRHPVKAAPGAAALSRHAG